jgi:hypothetical protein
MGPQEFPARCFECGNVDVYPDVISSYTAKAKHDGNLYEFIVRELHIQKCRSCGEVTFDSRSDEDISQGLRDHVGLLSPTEIRAYLDAFGWNQKEFAERLGSTPESVSRWLTGGHIQSRATDTSIRNLFELELMRRAQSQQTPEVVVTAAHVTASCPGPSPAQSTRRIKLPAPTGSSRRQSG